MVDSLLAKKVASLVLAVIIGILLLLFDVITKYQAFAWWQVIALTILTGIGAYEHFLGNRIWAGLILVLAILILLAPAFLYYA